MTRNYRPYFWEHAIDTSHPFIADIARQCRLLILECREFQPGLPEILQPKHLEWMCHQIENHSDGVPATKLHRWIGFVQAAMLAHRILDFDQLRTMIDTAKGSQRKVAEELEDLMDHLDPEVSFELDIGGEA
jgi:hypothetical protein